MIVVELIGGLGNQLFQYAIGRALAKDRQTSLKLDLSPFETYKLRAYSLQHFNIRATIANPSDLAMFEDRSPTTRLRRLPARLLGNPYRTVAERAPLKHDPSLFPSSRNLHLAGHWQTEA